MKHIHKETKIVQHSCTKHGVYNGPYCPECYEKAIGSDEPSVVAEKSGSD